MDSRAYKRSGEILQVDVQGRLARPTANNYSLALQYAFHYAKGVVHAPLHLVYHVVVGTPTPHAIDTCADRSRSNITNETSNKYLKIIEADVRALVPFIKINSSSQMRS